MKTNFLKTAIITITLTFTFLLNTTAQAPDIEWQKPLGGSSSEWANSIQQTADGGYIMAGRSTSSDGDVTNNHGDSDYWIVKLDSNGAIQWEKTFGGTGGEEANFIQQTTDGGYIVAGYSKSTDGDVTGNYGNEDYWIVKLDNTGAIQWQKSLGGSDTDIAGSIQQTSDGGYIVAGTILSTDGDITGNHGDYDSWIVKIDNTGAIQWQKSFGGSDADGVISIQQTTDGGYIIAGYSDSNDGDVTGNHGLDDCWIVKLDDTGTIQWQKALGGSDMDEVSSIKQTSDGGYIVAGRSKSNDGDVTGNHGENDYWIVKLTDTGAIQWQKSFGGALWDVTSSIQQTADGGYIVAGSSNSTDGDVTGNHGGHDSWIVKLNSSGIIQWQKSLGGSDDDLASSIQQTANEEYIVTGYTASTDGDVTGNHGDYDAWIVKLKAGSTGIPESFTTSSNIRIHPNPATDRIYFSAATDVRLFTLTGQFIAKAKNTRLLDISGLASGMYFIALTNSNGQIIQRDKIIKQ